MHDSFLFFFGLNQLDYSNSALLVFCCPLCCACLLFCRSCLPSVVCVCPLSCVSAVCRACLSCVSVVRVVSFVYRCAVVCCACLSSLVRVHRLSCLSVVRVLSCGYRCGSYSCFVSCGVACLFVMCGVVWCPSFGVYSLSFAASCGARIVWRLYRLVSDIVCCLLSFGALYHLVFYIVWV